MNLINKIYCSIILVFCVQISFAQIIVIDAGHGRCTDASHAGAVNGVTYNHDTRTQTELETSIAVALKLENLINTSSCNWTVHMTRVDNAIGSWVSIGARDGLSNSVGADHFISIHCNAGPTSAIGTETFWCNQSAGGSQTFGETLHNTYLAAVASIPIINRRVVEDNSYLGFHLGVLTNNNAKSCLAELGFGTNTTEAANLNNDGNRDIFAQSYFDALQIDLNQTCGNGCAPNANITSSNITGATTVSDFIVSSGDVPAGNNATFDAGNYIDLQTGFEGVYGSVFEGKIQGCVPFTSAPQEFSIGGHDNCTHGDHNHAIHHQSVLMTMLENEPILKLEKGNLSIDRIRIYDQNGTVVKDMAYLENLNYANLDKGSYTLRFTSNKNFMEYQNNFTVK